MKNSRQPKLSADCENTRARLVEAAVAIFAECGYQAATTRQICIRAVANAAAVNYHFGDKLGLYKAALKSLLARQEMVTEERALAALTPRLALRSFIYGMFDSLAGSDTADQYTQLMAHEMAEPTPGLRLVVDQIIEPRARLLCNIVARLNRHSPRSRQTRLAAHAIMAQILHYTHARPVIQLLWPRWHLDAAARRQLAKYVADFSLAGVMQAAKKSPKNARSRR